MRIPWGSFYADASDFSTARYRGRSPIAMQSAADLARETGLSLDEAQSIINWSNEGDDSTPHPSRSPDASSSAPESDLDFLRACFTDIPEIVIKLKLEQSQDVQQATDVLLNYRATQGEQNQYFDRAKARATKKKKQREKKLERVDKKGNQVSQLAQLLQVPEHEAMVLMDGKTFSDAICWYYRQQAAPHVQAVVSEINAQSGGVGGHKMATVESSTKWSPSAPRIDGIKKSQLRELRAKEEENLEAAMSLVHSYKNQSLGKGYLLADAHSKVTAIRDRLAEIDLMELRLEKTFDSRNQVDMHNMTVRAALEVLQDKLDQWLASRSRDIFFITGQGIHSRNGVPVIKNAFRDYFRRHSGPFQVHEETGGFYLTK